MRNGDGRLWMMKTYLNRTEVRLLEKSATNLRDRLLIRMLARLGCRISEVLAITPEDIDLKWGTVIIPHLKTRLKLSCPSCNARLGKAHSFCPKCGKTVKEAVAEASEHRKVRTLPVDDDTLKMLKQYIKRGGPVERNGKLLLFGVGRIQSWKIITECARKAGLESLVNPETGQSRGISPH